MVPNENCEYNLYKIYMLYGSKIFAEAKILSLHLKKSRKRPFSTNTSELFIILCYIMIFKKKFFYYNMSDAILNDFYYFFVKTPEKWVFSDFQIFHKFCFIAWSNRVNYNI